MALVSAAASVPRGDIFPLLYVVQPGGSAVTAFSGIPQQYQDLMVVTYASSAPTGGSHAHTLDNVRDTNGTSFGAIYSSITLYGNGSSANYYQSSVQGSWPLAVAGMTSGSWITSIVHFLNYSSTTSYKTIIAETVNDTNGAGARYLTIGNLQTTTAVGGFNISTYNGTYGWTSTTTQAVYGIKRLT